MTSLRVCAVLALVALVAVVSGVVLLAGVAWGLIAFGVCALAAAVLLYDPAERGSGAKSGSRQPIVGQGR